MERLLELPWNIWKAGPNVYDNCNFEVEVVY